MTVKGFREDEASSIRYSVLRTINFGQSAVNPNALCKLLSATIVETVASHVKAGEAVILLESCGQ